MIQSMSDMHSVFRILPLPRLHETSIFARSRWNLAVGCTSVSCLGVESSSTAIAVPPRVTEFSPCIQKMHLSCSV